ncbi:prolipoprotein diacylglyceryltransferase [Evansella vedderi]|uniref:Prolipoprotein diacylglyceryltransferase n=1 Tax=Evansella vedderi TaxID=38282 RepID=A0ABT9ZQT4_9BACI|nr:hypothetical protein [Evansella vedderi]MDQ0253604.1 prolipoprotein diacylglyceryltransferase [Evansella vedderi]
MLEPLHTFSFGPLTVTMEMLFFLLGTAFGYAIIHYYLKRLKVNVREEFLDSVLMGIVIGVIFYKFWPFLLEPSLLLDLRNILYFAGGPYASYGAIGIGFLYLIFQGYRKKWPYHCWDSLLFGTVSMLLFYSLCVKAYGAPTPFSFGFTVENTVYHPVNVYMTWLYLLLLGVSIFLVSPKVKYARTAVLLIGMVFIHLLVSPFSI